MDEQPGTNQLSGDASPGEQAGAESANVTAGIEEAVAGLDELADAPLDEHVERFDAVHTQLTVALSAIDKI